jgi:hypothetical protein
MLVTSVGRRIVKRKIIAVAATLASAVGLGVVSAPPAEAYAFWRNGYFYGDTSYRGNVPGVHVRVIGRRDTARQLYFLRVFIYDQRTDRNVSAVRVRGWDRQTNRWVMDGSASIGNGAKGSGETFFTIGTSVIDRIIVQDCIAGRTCGWNSVMVFRRY